MDTGITFAGALEAEMRKRINGKPWSGLEKYEQIKIRDSAFIVLESTFPNEIASLRLYQKEIDGKRLVDAVPHLSEAAKVGHRLWGTVGTVVNRLGGTNDTGELNRSGFSALYQKLALEFGLLPPDTMFAQLYDITPAGVSSARRFAREDGFELEEIRLDKSIPNAWWKVTKRPESKKDIERAVMERISSLSRDDLSTLRSLLDEAKSRK